MRCQPAKLVCLVILGCAVVPGCSSLRMPGDAGLFGAAPSPPANLDAPSPLGLSSTKPEAGSPAASPQDKLVEGEFALARLCEHRGENGAAKERYSAMLKMTPNDARLHHRLGVLAVEEGDFAAAQQHFDAARSLAAPTAELLSDYGYCLYLQQKLPEAENILNDALRVEPTYAAATNNLALVYGREGRCQEAFDLFKRTNTEAEACANVAYVLAQNGDLPRAREMYLRALTLDNGMRAAAQAALQIEQRSQVQNHLAEDGFVRPPLAPLAGPPAQTPAPPVSAAQMVGQAPQTPAGPEMTARPSS